MAQDDYTVPSARSFGQGVEMVEYEEGKFGLAVVPQADNVGTSNPITTTVTPSASTTITAPNSPITVTTSSTTVLAANSSRKKAAFVNYGTVGCFLWEGDTAAVGKGIYLAPNGGAYEIVSNNLYKGIVTAICASGSTTISLAEGV